MPVSEGASTRERLFGGYNGRLFIVLSLGATTARVSRRVVPPLLPAIIGDLGITSVEAGMTLTVMTVFFAMMQFPGGRLSDRLSRQTILVAGLSALMIGCVVLSLTPSYGILLLGVAILGAGEGLYGPADRALLSDLYREQRGRAFGIHMISLEVAGVIGAGLAAGILAASVWRSAFLPIVAVLGLVIVLFFIYNNESLRIASVSFNIRDTGRRLFKTRDFRGLLITYSLFTFSYQGIVGFLPTFLQTEKGFSPTFASTIFAVLFAVGIGARPAGGWLSDYWPRQVVGAVGLLVGVLGIGTIVVASSPIFVMIGVIIFAGGQKAFPPAIQAYLMDLFPDSSMGGDLGATRAVYIGFGSLGPTFVGVVATRASYSMAFIGLLLCLSVAGAFLLWSTRSAQA